MNKYDDIKRFIEKSKTEDLDYKEVNEKTGGDGITSSMSQWALIKQVSASEELPGLLDNGRTTQPTPQAVSTEEFQYSAPVTRALSGSLTPVEPQVETVADVVGPAIVHTELNILDSLRASLPTAPAAQPTPPAAVQPVIAAKSAPQNSVILQAQSVKPDSAGSLLDSVKNALPVQAVQAAPVIPPTKPVSQPAPAVAQPATTAAGGQFRQMFKQKAPQSAGAFLPRETPLQPLLEMIASCR